MDALYIDNSNVIKLEGLKNSSTGNADTGATVTATITDSVGNAISGETWPVTLPHDADGDYLYTLPPSVVLTKNRSYKAVVGAIGSGGEIGKWNCNVIARERECS